MQKHNAVALGGLLIFILMTGMFGMGLSGQRSAEAFPAYAKKEGKNCAFCHVNATGGGKRNATGKWYKAHGLSLVGYTPEKAAAESGGAAGMAVPAGVTGAKVAPKTVPNVKTNAKPTGKPAPKVKPAAKKPAPKTKPAGKSKPAPKK